MNNLPEIMGTGDVMEYLDVSKQRVYELIERGQLKPHSKTSAGIIFLKDDVVTYRRQRDLRKRRQRKEKESD